MISEWARIYFRKNKTSFDAVDSVVGRGAIVFMTHYDEVVRRYWTD
jgi:hypothetical protein